MLVKYRLPKEGAAVNIACFDLQKASIAFAVTKRVVISVFDDHTPPGATADIEVVVPPRGITVTRAFQTIWVAVDVGEGNCPGRLRGKS